MKRKRVGNSGSKYDFESKEFEKDVADKRKVTEEFTQELQDLMLKEVKYRNGIPISSHQRKLCIVEAIKRTYEILGG